MPDVTTCCSAVSLEAALVVCIAAVVKLGLYILLHLVTGLPPQLLVRAGFASQLMGSSFCAFCWAAGKIYSIVS